MPAAHQQKGSAGQGDVYLRPRVLQATKDLSHWCAPGGLSKPQQQTLPVTPSCLNHLNPLGLSSKAWNPRPHMQKRWYL